MHKICVFHEIEGLYHGFNSEFIIWPMVAKKFMSTRRTVALTRDDSDYARALIDVQIADVHYKRCHPIISISRKTYLKMAPLFYTRWKEFYLIPTILPRDENNEPFHTILLHSNISLKHIIIDPNTLKITRIIDWECTNASPKWQLIYPRFLKGPEVEEEPPGVEPDDHDLLLAKLKREFIYHVEFVEMTQGMVENWIKKTRENLKILGA